MLSLDLFDSKYERELREGAVDNLEARRIDDLRNRMDDLVARAKSATTPEHKAALMKEFQKCKTERDSYYKIKDEGIGYGGLGEAGIGQDLVTPQQRVQQSTPQKQTPVGKVVDTAKQAAKWLTGKGGPGKEGPTYESELDEQDDEAQAHQELGAGFGVYQELLKAWSEKKPYVIVPMPGGQNLSITRNQVFNVLYALKNMNDNTFKKTIANAFSSLDKFMVWSNSIKRYQLPKEKPQPAPGGIAPGGKEMVQQPLIKEAGQKKNSEKEVTPQSAEVQRYLTKARRAAPNAVSDLEALAKSELEKQRKTDNTINDLEAANSRQDSVLKKSLSLDRQQDDEIDNIEQQVGQLSQRLQAIRAVKPVADQPIKNTPATQSTASQNSTVSQPVKSSVVMQPIYVAEPEKLPQKDQEIYTQVKNLETELKNKIDSMATWNKVAQKDDESRNELEMLRKDMERTNRELNRKIKSLQKSGVNVQQASQKQGDLELGTPRSRDYVASLRQNLGQRLGGTNTPELPTPGEQDLNILSQTDLSTLGNLQRQPVAVEESQMSELDAVRQDLEIMTDQQFLRAYGLSKVAFQQKYRTLLKPANLGEHGGGIGPKQHWQDLMQERKLSVGDPIVVTGPNEFEGKTGEIYNFSPSGSFVIVDLYNHGKHSMHLSDVAYNDYADQEQDEEDDWYDEGVAEGWSDAIVAQRTGRPRTPYSIYIKGKKWKDFENEDHAEAVANKLRAKFKADGRDPKTITIAPTDMSESVNQAGALKSAQAAAKFIIRNLDDRAALKDYSMHFWSPEKFYQGATMAMRGAGFDEIVKQITQDRPAQFETKADPTGSWVVYNGNKVKRFKTHTGAKAYAEKAGGKVASSEFYADKVQKSGVDEAIVASGPSQPLDDRAVRKMVWDTMKINADTGEQALQRALSVLAKKPQSRMVQDLQDKFQSLADRLAQGVAEEQKPYDPNEFRPVGPITIVPPKKLKSSETYQDRNKYWQSQGQAPIYKTNEDDDPRAGMAQIYRKLAPKIERYKDSFLAGQLYDELENYAELHGAEKEFKQMMNGARNRAHMEYDTNPGGFHNWFWFLPFAEETNEGLMKEPTNRKEYLDQRDKLFRMLSVESDLASKQIIKQAIKDLDARYGAAKDPIREESSTGSEAVEIALIRRVLVAHTDLIMEFGLDKVTQAIEEVAYDVGDVDEIGTSDVSAWIHQVKQILGATD